MATKFASVASGSNLRLPKLSLSDTPFSNEAASDSGGNCSK